MDNKSVYDFSKFDTGDILLFGSKKSKLSELIEWWCDSKWSHVGIILKDPKFIDYKLKGYYLLESGYEDFVDAEDNIKKYGVQIVPLEKVFQEYNGYIYWRQLKLNIDKLKENYKNDIKNDILNNNKTEEEDIDNVSYDNLMTIINLRLATIYKSIKNKPYDLSLYDLFSLKMNIDVPEIKSNNPFFNWISTFGFSHKKLDSFICSGLVAYIYTELGFLDKNTEWSECMPKYFSSENKDLKLLKCHITPEVKVK